MRPGLFPSAWLIIRATAVSAYGFTQAPPLRTALGSGSEGWKRGPVSFSQNGRHGRLSRLRLSRMDDASRRQNIS